MAEPDDAWSFPPWFFLLGVGLVALAALQPLFAWGVSPQWGLGLGGTMAAELVSNRETAIPIALEQGVPPAWIALTSFLQNLGLAAIVVPGVAAGLGRGEASRGRVGRMLARVHHAAASQRHRAGSAWALYLFMLVPFLANGAIIAGVLGFLAGIEPRRLLLAVTAGVATTATAWSFGYAWLAEALAGVDPRLARIPFYAALALAAVAAVRLAILLRRKEPGEPPAGPGGRP